jgi:hypothetical protein
MSDSEQYLSQSQQVGVTAAPDTRNEKEFPLPGILTKNTLELVRKGVHLGQRANVAIGISDLIQVRDAAKKAATDNLKGNAPVDLDFETGDKIHMPAVQLGTLHNIMMGAVEQKYRNENPTANDVQITQMLKEDLSDYDTMRRNYYAQKRAQESQSGFALKPITAQTREIPVIPVDSRKK